MNVTFDDLVKKGIFLNEVDWDWLDEFRRFIVNEIIDNLTLFSSKLDEKEVILSWNSGRDHILFSHYPDGSGIGLPIHTAYGAQLDYLVQTAKKSVIFAEKLPVSR